jgi:alpha-glucosidase (family GH31 glycosyl hydrolase)
VETKVWFPPGEWTDYFSGRTYVGPSTATVTNNLSTMPVFIRSGGVLPTRTNAVSNDAQAPLDQVTLDVATGGDGSFTLYEDAGEGHGYRSGASARTAIGYAESTRTLTIAARDGSYPGAVPSRTWTLRFRAVDGPATVRVNGSVVASTYDAATRTLTARTSALAAGTPTVVSLG